MKYVIHHHYHLKLRLSELEDMMLPYLLKGLNMHSIIDPYQIIQSLHVIKAYLNLSCTKHLLPLFGEEINILQNECKEILRDNHKLCRKLNQRVQRNFYEKSYDELIQTLEEFIRNYPVLSVAQNAVTIAKKILPYCDGYHNGELLHEMETWCEFLQVKTCDYHDLTTVT